jgi:aspartyl-tRNA(Asn)/glutamyl-tRNA(Gln) amidotransferase subunit A
LPVDILKTRSMIERGETTLNDVVSQFAQNIEKLNPAINAVTSLFTDQAINEAKRVQQKIESGKAGKLAGSVFGIKEAIVMDGTYSTAASKMLSSYKSVYNATVIDRLIAEDAIILGRCNMDEFAMGSSNENSYYGPVKNPLDHSRVPGGSSGGSAAAVAAGFMNASLGSDTGGSIRQPAAYCGVTGMKPSYGRVSRYGLIAYASSFDSIGPIANSVLDTATIMEVLAGRDPRDGTTSHQPVEEYTKVVMDPSGSFKVGVPAEYFGDGLDPEIRSQIEDILKRLEKDSVELVPLTLPHTPYAIATYYILATAEASSNLARFDGARYGYRADMKEISEQLRNEENALKQNLKVADSQSREDLERQLRQLDTPLLRMYKRSRSEGFGLEVQKRIMLGTYVLSSGYYDAYYGKAQKIRRLIRDDFSAAFEKVDVIVSPTAPSTAFKIGENINDPIQMYLNDIYTISANLAGICGISLPIGKHSDGLPIGLQLMANSMDEMKLFKAASRIEKLVSDV